MEIKTDPVNLETLFSGYATKYMVPDYQRDYSWTSDQVDELWTDIITSLKTDSEYFMGAIVLNRQEAEDHYEIVDGQQRLSTFTILFSVVASLAKAFKDNSQVFPNCIRTTENLSIAAKVEKMAMDRLYYTSEPDNYFLIINKKDRETFSAVIKDLNTVILTEQELKIISNESRVKKTRKLFFKSVLDHFGSHENAIEQLYKTLVHFIKRLKFIRIIVSSDIDAFLLFESLNSKGMDLSIADLVKNKLLMIGANTNDSREAVLGNWDFMVSNIEGKSRISSVDYLRTYWISFPGKNTTKKELYKNIKTYLTSGSNNVLEFSRDLSKKSATFAALTDKSLIWPESQHKKEGLYKVMGELNVLKYTLCHPVILYATCERPNDAEIIARLSLSFLFRWVTIGNFYVGKAFDVFAHVLLALKNDESLESVIAPFSTEKDRISDEEFERAFRVFRTQDNTVAKYVLGRIHAHEKSYQLIPAFNELHLEHVLPQQTSKWHTAEGFELLAGTNYEDWIYHIGNLTLLAKDANMSVQNKVFEDKVDAYSESPFAMTSAIGIRHALDSRSWSPDWINERAEAWAKIAPKIWSMDP